MVPVSPIVTKADNCNSQCQNEADGDEYQIDVALVTSRRHGERDEKQEAQNGPGDWRQLVLSRQAELHLCWLNQSLFENLMAAIRAFAGFFENVIRHAILAVPFETLGDSYLSTHFSRPA